jgi:hypothetical protein
MTFLSAKTLDLGNRNAGDPQVGQGLPDVIQLEGFDDGGNQFHGVSLGD